MDNNNNTAMCSCGHELRFYQESKPSWGGATGTMYICHRCDETTWISISWWSLAERRRIDARKAARCAAFDERNMPAVNCRNDGERSHFNGDFGNFAACHDAMISVALKED